MAVISRMKRVELVSLATEHGLSLAEASDLSRGDLLDWLRANTDVVSENRRNTGPPKAGDGSEQEQGQEQGQETAPASHVHHIASASAGMSAPTATQPPATKLPQLGSILVAVRARAMELWKSQPVDDAMFIAIAKDIIAACTSPDLLTLTAIVKYRGSALRSRFFANCLRVVMNRLCQCELRYGNAVYCAIIDIVQSLNEKAFPDLIQEVQQVKAASDGIEQSNGKRASGQSASGNPRDNGEADEGSAESGAATGTATNETAGAASSRD
jgi:hypothetical protein